MDVSKCRNNVSPPALGCFTQPNTDFRRALAKEPQERTMQDLEIIFRHLHRSNILHKALKDPSVKEVCQRAKYETHGANDILYCRGEYNNCWYILLSGSVFIDGSMFLPNSSFGKRVPGSNRRLNECLVLENSELLVIAYDESKKNIGPYPPPLTNSTTMDVPTHRDDRTSSPYYSSRSLTRQAKVADPLGGATLIGPVRSQQHQNIATLSMSAPQGSAYNSLGRARRNTKTAFAPCRGEASRVRCQAIAPSPAARDRGPMPEDFTRWPVPSVRGRVNSDSSVVVDMAHLSPLDGIKGSPTHSASPNSGDCVDRGRPRGIPVVSSYLRQTRYGSGKEMGASGPVRPCDSFLYPAMDYKIRGTPAATSIMCSVMSDLHGVKAYSQAPPITAYERYSVYEETTYSQVRPVDPAPDYYNCDDRRSSECDNDVRARFMVDLSGLEESLVDSEDEDDNDDDTQIVSRKLSQDDVFYEQSPIVSYSTYHHTHPSSYPGDGDVTNLSYLDDGVVGMSPKAALKSLLEKDPYERTTTEIGLMASWLDPGNPGLPLDLSSLARAFVGSRSGPDFRRAVCGCAILATVPDSQTLVMNRGEQLDSWCIVFEGQVEVAVPCKDSRNAGMTPGSLTTPTSTSILVAGDCFGVEPVEGPQFFGGVMRTLTPWCSFLCVSQDDYVAITRTLMLEPPLPTDYEHLRVSPFARTRPNGDVVGTRKWSLDTNDDTTNKGGAVLDADSHISSSSATTNTTNNDPSKDSLNDVPSLPGSQRCSIVIQDELGLSFSSESGIGAKLSKSVTRDPVCLLTKGTPATLINHLIAEHGTNDSTYIEDFLLTYRVFIPSPSIICDHLLRWFQDKPELKEKTTRIVLLWVNNHFNDFEKDLVMMEFLENFEALLDKQQMHGQLRLLNMACFAKAKNRTITLTRSTREDILHFSILGGWERGSGIYISKVEQCSKAAELGLKRGDQVLEVNGQNFEYISHTKALDLFRNSTHLSITVRSNLLGFKQLLNASLSTVPGNNASTWASPKLVVQRRDDEAQPLATTSAHDRSFRSDSEARSSFNAGSIPLLQSLWHQRKLKFRKALGRMNLLTQSGHSQGDVTSTTSQLALGVTSVGRQQHQYDSCGSIERHLQPTTRTVDKPQPSSLSACTTKQRNRQAAPADSHGNGQAGNWLDNVRDSFLDESMSQDQGSKVSTASDHRKRNMAKFRSSLVKFSGGSKACSESGASSQGQGTEMQPPANNPASSVSGAPFNLFRSSFGLSQSGLIFSSTTQNHGLVDSKTAPAAAPVMMARSSYNPFTNYEYFHAASYHPEHVLKVYKGPRDLAFKFLLIHKETSAKEVVMLALREFGCTESSSRYSLFEVSVENGGVIRRKRLPDQLNNLADRIGLNARYYIKNNYAPTSTGPNCEDTNVDDNSSASQERVYASDLLSQAQISFDQEGRVSVPLDSLKSFEVAVQLTLRDFDAFSKIESAEYIIDLFGLAAKHQASLSKAAGAPSETASKITTHQSAHHLQHFEKIIDKEMFWVVNEIVNEPRLLQRSKTLKLFVKVAKHCRDLNNFNSAFAVVSGLGHRAVSRLTATWDKLPTKYCRLYDELQRLMDPSRNMSCYRTILAKSRPPVIPFFPLIKKDLTFIHLGNVTYYSPATKAECDVDAESALKSPDALSNGHCTGITNDFSGSAVDSISHNHLPQIPLADEPVASQPEPASRTSSVLVNFDKMRMISREIRTLVDMCSVPFDFRHALDTYGAHSLATNASMMVNWWSSSAFAPSSSSAAVLPPKLSNVSKASGSAKSEVNLNFVGTKKLASASHKGAPHLTNHHSSDPDLFTAGSNNKNQRLGPDGPPLSPLCSQSAPKTSQTSLSIYSTDRLTEDGVRSNKPAKAKYTMGRRSGIMEGGSSGGGGATWSSLNTTSCGSATASSSNVVPTTTGAPLPPNPKKMYERALGIRRVRAYLLGALGANSDDSPQNPPSAEVNLAKGVDEDNLIRLSYACEPPASILAAPASATGSSEIGGSNNGPGASARPTSTHPRRQRRPYVQVASGHNNSTAGTDPLDNAHREPMDNSCTDGGALSQHKLPVNNTSDTTGSLGKSSSISGGLLHHFAVTRLGGRKKNNFRSLSQTDSTAPVSGVSSQQPRVIPSPNTIPKFGTDSPQAIQKLMALSEGTRCKPTSKRGLAPLPPVLCQAVTNRTNPEDSTRAQQAPTLSVVARHGRSNSSDNAQALLHSLAASTRLVSAGPLLQTAPPARKPPGSAILHLSQESSSVTSLSWTSNQAERCETRGQTLPTTSTTLTIGREFKMAGRGSVVGDGGGGVIGNRCPLKTYSDSYGSSNIFESIDSGRGSAASSAAALANFGSDASFYLAHPRTGPQAAPSLASSGSSLLSTSPSSFLRDHPRHKPYIPTATNTRRSFSPPSLNHHHPSSPHSTKNRLSPPPSRPISSPDNAVNPYRINDVTTLTRHKKSNGSQHT